MVERHGIEQMARQQNAALGVNLAYMLLGRSPSGVEQAGIQVGAGAFFARHSREAEREADRVGGQYLVAVGHQPAGDGDDVPEAARGAEQRAEPGGAVVRHPPARRRSGSRTRRPPSNALPAAARQG